MALTLDKLWYEKHPLRWLLWPFSAIYKFLINLRRFFLVLFRQHHFPVPVIVVGNLTLGGVGKTPLVISIAKQLRARGIKVGIVSRGYGARIRNFPHKVLLDDSAIEVGDEPLLIAEKTDCPVVIAPKRVQALRYLLENEDCEIIISDDGLQHYAMGRAIEIIVIDGLRQLGNGFCLPAGPLREAPSRLQKSDLIVVNGGEWPGAHLMNLEPGPVTHLLTGKKMDHQILSMPAAAVAGIGNPERFFNTLQKLGIAFIKYPFQDHHCFKRIDLQLTEKIVIMTEKDAVKCKSFAAESWYFLPVEAKLTDSFWQALYSHKKLQGMFR